jgi:hypothetical protein
MCSYEMLVDCVLLFALSPYERLVLSLRLKEMASECEEHSPGQPIREGTPAW